MYFWAWDYEIIQKRNVPNQLMNFNYALLSKNGKWLYTCKLIFHSTLKRETLALSQVLSKDKNSNG